MKNDMIWVIVSCIIYVVLYAIYEYWRTKKQSGKGSEENGFGFGDEESKERDGENQKQNPIIE